MHAARLESETEARCRSEKVCTQPCVANTSEKVKPMADSSTRMGSARAATSQPPRPYSASSEACTAALHAQGRSPTFQLELMSCSKLCQNRTIFYGAMSR